MDGGVFGRRLELIKLGNNLLYYSLCGVSLLLCSLAEGKGPINTEARSRRLAARRPGGRQAADRPWRLSQRTCWRRAAASPRALAKLSAGSDAMGGTPVPQRTTGSSGATATVKQHWPDRERNGRTGVGIAGSDCGAGARWLAESESGVEEELFLLLCLDMLG